MKNKGDDKRTTVQMLTLITQLGLVMIVSVGMTTALGIWLDGLFGTSFITVIFFFIGAVAGMQGAYRMMGQAFKDDSKGGKKQ